MHEGVVGFDAFSGLCWYEWRGRKKLFTTWQSWDILDLGLKMKAKARHLAHLRRCSLRTVTAELSMLSTTESTATWQIRLQGRIFGIVDRRGFMN